MIFIPFFLEYPIFVATFFTKTIVIRPCRQYRPGKNLQKDFLGCFLEHRIILQIYNRTRLSQSMTLYEITFSILRYLASEEILDRCISQGQG